MALRNNSLLSLDWDSAGAMTVPELFTPPSPNDTTCRYECTLAESELAGKEISEIGLYDTNGDIVCIKTFTRKGKDDDVEQTYVLDDIF